MYASTPIDTLRPRAFELLRQHGNRLLVYGGLLEGWPIYWSREGDGFCLYGTAGRTAIMLEAPVGPPERCRQLAWEWCCQMRARGYAAAIVQTPRPLADGLAQAGFYVNPMGTVTTLPLADFDFELRGKHFAHLRHWRNTARRSEAKVFDLDHAPHGTPPVPELLHSMNARQAGGRRMRFLVRATAGQAEPECRRFVAVVDGRPVAIGVFEPLFRDRRLAGYYFSINKRAAGAPNGISDLLLLEAMRRFAEEGCDAVSLGLSPLWNMQPDHRASPGLSWAFRTLRRWGDRLYHFEGVGFHKEKYRGIQEPVYCAVRSPLPVREVISALALCGILPGRLARRLPKLHMHSPTRR